MKGDIYIRRINGTTTEAPELLTPNDRTLTISTMDFSRRERTANATLKVDVVNRKKKFTLNYATVSEDTLLQLIRFLEYDLELELIIYEIDGITYDTYTVVMMPFDYTRFRVTGSGLWSNVAVELEEV